MGDPVRIWVGNQPYMSAGILARNLTRELQIQIDRRARGTTPKRAALWCFREMETLRRTPVRRTGRIICPGGKSILSMNSNDSTACATVSSSTSISLSSL